MMIFRTTASSRAIEGGRKGALFIENWKLEFELE